MNKINSEGTVQTPLLPFWNNRKKKLWSIFWMVVAVFILTLPWSILSIFIYPMVIFPTGLVSLVNNTGSEDLYASLLLWIVYIGMATTIVRSNKRKVVVCLYITLTLLLILNVAGCQIVAPVITSKVH